MKFEPDYTHFLNVLENKRPNRLPVYEHIISPSVMEKILNTQFAELFHGNSNDRNEFFSQYCHFFKEMTYDVVSYEICISEILPDSGAIMGGKPGPIQTRSDFEKYPWEDLPDIFFNHVNNKFDLLIENLPPGMQIIGGIGNGVFELSEDLAGLEYLPFMQIDDPDLYADLFTKIGDLMFKIWGWFLKRYCQYFVGCRIGDDLGFKNSLLTNPKTVREFIIPQYKKVIGLIHSYRKPFLWHSCGCIFEIMDDFIELGINAKHSNEDVIAPFDEWISKYGSRIGLLGGIDLDLLCSKNPQEIYDIVLDSGQRFRSLANGYALGSGNSIPDYVPPEKYLAMINAAIAVRHIA